MIIKGGKLMRIEKVGNHYKEQITVKNNADIIPFDENELTQVQNGKLSNDSTVKSLMEQEYVNIDTKMGHVIKVLDLNIDMSHIKNSLITVFKGISSERPILFPIKAEIMDNGSVNFITSDGNIVTITNINDLLNFDNYEKIYNQKVINITKENDNVDKPTVLNLEIYTNKPTKELESTIKNIYGSFDSYNETNNDNVSSKHSKILLSNNKPVSVNLKLQQIDVSGNKAMQSIIRTINKNEISIENNMLVKILDDMKTQIYINGNTTDKQQNLLDFLFNRNSMVEPENSPYPSNGSIQYAILIFDNLNNALSIDISGVGILYLEDKNIKKIISYLPHLAAMYYTPEWEKWYHKLFRKYANWKTLIALLLVILSLVILI